MKNIGVGKTYSDHAIDMINEKVEETLKESWKEKADRMGVPIIEPLPEIPDGPTPNPIVAICGQCGIELHQIMGFSCGKDNCPCFPQIRS